MKETSCVYLIQDHQWLMLLRNRKANDENEGKWIGIGGKKEPGETMEQCAVREVWEETGLHLDDLRSRGLVYFHYEDHEDEVITVYTSSRFHGDIHEDDEGTLKWIPQDAVLDLNLWEGDRIFLQKILDENSVPFMLNLYYDPHGRLTDWKEGEVS